MIPGKDRSLHIVSCDAPAGNTATRRKLSPYPSAAERIKMVRGVGYFYVLSSEA